MHLGHQDKLQSLLETKYIVCMNGTLIAEIPKVTRLPDISGKMKCQSGKIYQDTRPVV